MIDNYNSEINAFISINDRKLLEEKAKESDHRREQGLNFIVIILLLANSL